jgi:glutathione S-transferase
MALEECGLADRVEVLAVPTRVPDSPVNALVPTGKVPTLVTDDGLALSESRLICQYLDRLHGAAPVVDPDPAPAGRALEGVVTGFLDGVSVWVRELRRPAHEQSPGILEQERARAERCVAWLEARVEDIGLVGWREAAPRLWAWFESFRGRPAYRSTAPAP